MDSPSDKSRLTIFCGKGGVGKTTISLSYGFWHANRGKKALVVTSHSLKELAVAISLSGLKDRFPEAAANLLVVHIDPREILDKKIRQQIPSELVANKVLNSRIYQSLVEVAPGLKEIAFLSRLKHLAERETEGIGKAYDLIIWDAPATGHFLQIMKVSKNLDTYLSGPFAILGRDVHSFFSNPEKIRLVPVTMLEEMAVEETIELCGDLDHSVQLHPATLICNLVSPLLGLTDEAFSDLRDHLGLGGLEAAGMKFAGLKFAMDRHVTERELARKLQSSVNASMLTVRRVPDSGSDLEQLVSISSALGDSLAGALA